MKFGLILTLCLSYFTVSPPVDIWEILSKIKFKITFDEKLDDVFFTPQPTKAIKKLIGKSIILEGFKHEIVFEGDSKLKKNVVHLCRYEPQKFSCCVPYGAESYIKVVLNKGINIVEGKSYRFKGVFELNMKDPLELPFILKKAECLNCTD
jgi:hypothetical protein